MQRITKFNQEAWFKPYINMNIELRISGNNDFEKNFFKFMKNVVFGKAMDNLRKHRDIKLVLTEGRTNYLVLEQSYHTTKTFSDYSIAIKMKRIQILMNKPLFSFLYFTSINNVHLEVSNK